MGNRYHVPHLWRAVPSGESLILFQGTPVEEDVPEEAMVGAVEIAVDRVEVEGDDPPLPCREIENGRTALEIVLAFEGAADQHLDLVLLRLLPALPLLLVHRLQ